VSAITESDVAEALSELLAAQIRKSADTPDDPERMVRAYLRALRGIDLAGLEAAVEELITKANAKWLPAPYELAALAKRLAPKDRVSVRPPVVYSYVVVGTLPFGPQVRLKADGDALGLQQLADARCPHECHCSAVEVELPVDLDMRRLVRGGEPIALGGTLQGRVRREFLWRCAYRQVPTAKLISTF
jgi:hypothetical protein